MRIRYFFVRFWFIVRAASWKHFHLNGFDFNFFILFTKLIHLGWSFKSSVLAPRRQPRCYAYVSTSWGRKLPNLGKINANGIDCQEQVTVYWWHIDTSTLEEEEGAYVEEGRGVGAASIISTRGHFAASCAALLRIDFLLMAPMTWKRGEGGMVTCMCVRMRVIAEGKMSLSCVVVSW